MLSGLSHLIKRPVTHKLIFSNPQVILHKHIQVSANIKAQQSAPTSKFPGFEPIFISPHVRHIKIACRLKLYQTGFILCMVPYSLYLLKADQILPSQVGLAAGFSLVSLLVLGSVGEFFRKFIGILYLSEDKTKVIISHNTFLGVRNDVWVDVENIIPLSDSPEDLDELVWKLHLYSGNPRTFYICTRFGGIVSRKSFADVFGTEIFTKK